MQIRDAQPRDLPQILAIYNEIIAASTAVYSLEPTTLAERAEWREQRLSRGFPVLVAVDGDEVLGFSSFGEFRVAFAGYRYSVEHSVHVGSRARGRGIGRSLVTALFPRAAALGKHVMIAGVDAANEGSIRMHRRLGFERGAVLREVGRKFGRWLDLELMQKFLDAPGAPR